MAKKPRNKMPIADRAKQFMPFSALKGLEEALENAELHAELHAGLHAELHAELLPEQKNPHINTPFPPSPNRMYEGT